MPIGYILYTITDYSVLWDDKRKDFFPSRDEAESWAAANLQRWTIEPVTTMGRVGG